MTVRELTQALATLDPDMRVFVNGYEGGAVDLPSVHVRRVHLNAREGSYSGDHEVLDSDPSDADYIKWNWFDDGEPTIITGVYLPRS